MSDGESGYQADILRRWETVNKDIDKLRAERFSTSAKIQKLVKERDKLRRLVRIIDPELVAERKATVHPDE